MKKFFKNLKLKLQFLFVNRQGGMSALLVVVIIGASSIVMAQGVAFLSIGELEMGQVVNRGNNALYLSEACISEALFRLKLDSSFLVADEELLFGDSSCLMSVTADGNERTIFSVGIDGEYRKSIEAKVTISLGVVNLDSYAVVDN